MLGQNINTSDWNPLLIAIYNNQLDVVRYFANDLNVPVKYLVVDAPEPQIMKEKVEMEIIGLKAAISIKSEEILEVLWGVFQAWNVNHLDRVIELIIEQQWGSGLQIIIKSYTTDVIFNGLSMRHQMRLMAKWWHTGQNLGGEVEKQFKKAIGTLRLQFILAALDP